MCRHVQQRAVSTPTRAFLPNRGAATTLEHEHEVLERHVLPVNVSPKWINVATHKTESSIQAPARILILDDLEIDGSHATFAAPIESGRHELTPHSTPTVCGVKPDSPERRAMTPALSKLACDTRHANRDPLMQCEHDQGVAFARARGCSGIPNIVRIGSNLREGLEKCPGRVRQRGKAHLAEQATLVRQNAANVDHMRSGASTPMSPSPRVSASPVARTVESRNARVSASSCSTWRS